MQVVQTDAAQGMLKAISTSDRDTYRRDPAKVAQLVDKYLLPHFDTEFAAQLVLGRYWKTATQQQRERFIDAFYHSLLTNYGAALVDFTSDRLKIFPTSVDPGAARATVRTEVKRDNGDRVSVNYYMRKTAEGWKAWDVVIDGISYVNSYREDFGPQIEKEGIDAVISGSSRAQRPGAIIRQTREQGRVSRPRRRPQPPAHAAPFRLSSRRPARCWCRGRSPLLPRAERARAGRTDQRPRTPPAPHSRSTVPGSAPATARGLRYCSSGSAPRSARVARCATRICRGHARPLPASARSRDCSRAGRKERQASCGASRRTAAEVSAESFGLTVAAPVTRAERRFQPLPGGAVSSPPDSSSSFSCRSSSLGPRPPFTLKSRFCR